MFPAYDEDNPATMSHAILQGLLRERFGYERLIVSDDMEMKAVRGRWPLQIQLDRSCRAGVDLFLFCKEHELQEEAFEILVRLQEEDPAHDRLAIESQKRLLALRKQFFAQARVPTGLEYVGARKHHELSARIRSRGAS